MRTRAWADGTSISLVVDEPIRAGDTIHLDKDTGTFEIERGPHAEEQTPEEVRSNIDWVTPKEEK